MAKNDRRKASVSNARSLRVKAGDRVIGARDEWTESRIEIAESTISSSQEEILVVDDRAGLRPAQVVETKLTRMLQEASVSVSHLQMRELLTTR
jgi:hypothetical protein